MVNSYSRRNIFYLAAAALGMAACGNQTTPPGNPKQPPAEVVKDTTYPLEKRIEVDGRMFYYKHELEPNDVSIYKVHDSGGMPMYQITEKHYNTPFSKQKSEFLGGKIYQGDKTAEFTVCYNPGNLYGADGRKTVTFTDFDGTRYNSNQHGAWEEGISIGVAKRIRTSESQLEKITTKIKEESEKTVPQIPTEKNDDLGTTT